MVTCTLFDTLTARCGRQVTHTDLKPENMLIGCDNQIKLCDFGMGQRAAAGTMWAVTGELSTLWYRAPELLLGCKTFPDERLTCRKVLAMPLFQHASTFVVQPDLRGGTTSSAGSVSASFDFRQQPKTPANSSTRQALQHAYSQNSNMQGCG